MKAAFKFESPPDDILLPENPTPFHLDLLTISRTLLNIDTALEDDMEVLEWPDPPRIEITDDMRRILPPGAVDRIVDERSEVVVPNGGGAMLRRVVALGRAGVHVSGGSQYASVQAPYATHGPYTHGYIG